MKDEVGASSVIDHRTGPAVFTIFCYYFGKCCADNDERTYCAAFKTRGDIPALYVLLCFTALRHYFSYLSSRCRQLSTLASSYVLQLLACRQQLLVYYVNKTMEESLPTATQSEAC